MEHCPNCDGELKIIAAILRAPVIEKILTRLGLEAHAPPRAPAYGQAAAQPRRCMRPGTSGRWVRLRPRVRGTDGSGLAAKGTRRRRPRRPIFGAAIKAQQFRATFNGRNTRVEGRVGHQGTTKGHLNILSSARSLGSGTILPEVLMAAQWLADEHGTACEVSSTTSYSELARQARELQRLDRSEPQPSWRVSHVGRLQAGPARIVAASDYVRAWPQLITEYVDAKLVTLGTDCFGRSTTLARMRRYSEVDAQAVVAAALDVLRPA